MKSFITGETEASSVPEGPREEKHTQILSPTQGDEIHALLQDSPDAHEEFLERQSTQGLDEGELDGKHLEGEQQGEGLVSEQRENDDQNQSEMKQPAIDEEEGVNPEWQGEEENKVVEMLEKEQLEDPQQQNQTDFVRNTGGEQTSKVELQPVKRLLPLVRAAPSESDEVTARSPGPLVTELDDTEHLDLIQLPASRRPLRIDDLPDLEDMDTEDQISTTLFSSQQTFKARIEVISGDSDEDEPIRYQSDATPTFDPGENSLFSMSGGSSSAEVCNHPLPQVDPEDVDAWEPLLFEPVEKSKANQVACPPHWLIEELD